ncbi:MAG: tRNA 4-thiouridine(8) synthase ThiI [bacterium]
MEIKCILLSSGGLDSLLAEEIIKRQGIQVKIVEFKTPFFGSSEGGVDISDSFFDILKNPKFGYGKNLNPCIDCKILMLKKAKELMMEKGADFMATGEVVGQRPMSQGKDKILKIEKEAGAEGLVLRPLSAHILPETFPEKNGWVKQKELFAIEGRSRKEQMDLAEKFGIENYPEPSGGCLLTDAGFSLRMKDLMRINLDFTQNDIELIKSGRFFPIGSGFLVIGRDKNQNARLMELEKNGDIVFDYTSSPGPFAILRGDNSIKTRVEAEEIVKRYLG